jgi:hypothetical protein
LAHRGVGPPPLFPASALLTHRPCTFPTHLPCSTHADIATPLRGTSTPWKTPARPDPKRFTYDRVFGPDSTQAELFESVRPTVLSVLDGFNATVLSYGCVGVYGDVGVGVVAVAAPRAGGGGGCWVRRGCGAKAPLPCPSLTPRAAVTFGPRCALRLLCRSTGAGKTFTILGKAGEQRGVLHRQGRCPSPPPASPPPHPPTHTPTPHHRCR